MTPFDCLTDKDLDLINEYIERFALGYEEYPSCSRNTDLEYILRYWNDAKNDHLFKMFGEKLILEKEVVFNKSNFELIAEFGDAFNSNEKIRNFREKFLDIIDTDIVQFSDDWHNMYELVSAETLAHNMYQYTWKKAEISLKNGSLTLKLTPGMKPMKALSKFADAYGLTREFEQFRIAHSMLLNQKTITGTLCLSIHPLDYMTMSDNDMNWDSCMNWREPGEYRQGTVEMMNSENVVVAYLKGHKDFNFAPGYSWNNKRWRTLVVVDKLLTANVKGYPYQSKSLNEEVQKWITELAMNNLGWDYKYQFWYNGEYVYDSPEGGESIGEIYFCTNKMYNDFGCLGDFGRHMIRAIDDCVMDWPYQIYYSGATECIWCGDETSDIEECAVICNNCIEVYYCDDCGSRTSRDDLREVDGQLICEYCFDSHYKTDPISGELHNEEDLVCIYVSPFKDGFFPHDDCSKPQINILLEAYDDDTLKKYFVNGSDSIKTATLKYTWVDDSYYYVSLWDLTKDGLELFDISEEEKEKFKIDDKVESSYKIDSIFDVVKKYIDKHEEYKSNFI